MCAHETFRTYVQPFKTNTKVSETEFRIILVKIRRAKIVLARDLET